MILQLTESDAAPPVPGAMTLPERTASPASTILPDYVTVAAIPEPPRYWTHERPAMPITYKFSTLESSPIERAVIVQPPSDMLASSSPPPTYTVTVSLEIDPFLPISFVTKIYRMTRPPSSVRSDVLAEFQMSINNSRAILKMGEQSVRLDNVLTKLGHSYRHWMWNFNGVSLRWDCRTTLEDGSIFCMCHSTDSVQLQLATFVPPPVSASPPLPDPELTVFPDGHEFFDHILLSSLIIARKLTQ